MANPTFTMTDIQKVNVTISAVDGDGNPTQLDPGVVPAWSSSDPSICSVVASGDGLTGVCISGTALGTATITVSATIGGAVVTGELDITITSSAAVGFSLTPGSAVAK